MSQVSRERNSERRNVTASRLRLTNTTAKISHFSLPALSTELSLPALNSLVRPAVAGPLRWWKLVPVAAVWLLALWGVSNHWRTNPQYGYGWFVPLLALHAAWFRWQSRPQPSRPWRGAQALGGLVCFLLLPTWIFSLPNADWPLVNWVFVGEAVAITLCVVAATGGASWLRHFFFPAVFVFTAVPWPDQLEAPLMHAMMQTVAAVAVAGLDLIGVSALQHGNLIEVASGVVGVDEACSGIRSLQGALMASLFLGELYRFGSGKRLLLVGLSLLVAFGSNILRAGFLAWSAARGGVGAVTEWHDPAGWTTLAACVVVLFLLARYLGRNEFPAVAPARRAAPAALPSWVAPAVLAWVGLTVGAAEWWYYDGAPIPPSRWRWVQPEGSQRQAVPAKANAYLHYDEGTALSGRCEDGGQWFAYQFDWAYGPAFTRLAAQMHRPDICLPAAGTELRRKRGLVPFELAGETLNFRAYEFEHQGSPIFVYHGIWQFRSTRGSQHGVLAEGKQLASWQSVLWRERDLGQQISETVLLGYSDAAAADAAFSRLLPQLMAPRDQIARP